MKSELLRHAGYAGSVEVSIEDNCLHGRILHINDLITYEGESVDEIRKNFTDAVDDYLRHCREIGKNPDKPVTGSLNVRLGEDRHRKLLELSLIERTSINEVICVAVDHYCQWRDDFARAQLADSIQLLSNATSLVRSQSFGSALAAYTMSELDHIQFAKGRTAARGLNLFNSEFREVTLSQD